jgi:phosphoribosylformylglycinamidine (FGAM) synthase PurS component
MTDARGIGAERRRDTGGQTLRHEAHSLEYAGASEIQVDVVFEDDVDHRKAERRL